MCHSLNCKYLRTRTKYVFSIHQYWRPCREISVLLRSTQGCRSLRTLMVRHHKLYQHRTSVYESLLASFNAHLWAWVHWVHALSLANISTTARSLLQTTRPIPMQVLAETPPLKCLFQTPLWKLSADTRCYPNRVRGNAVLQLHYIVSHYDRFLTIVSQQLLIGLL